MMTSKFKDLTLSRLGFGTMRLPLLDKDPAHIDAEQVDRMVDYCMEHGINYFDTAYPYHSGMSETVIGKSLARYPRERYYLASKYPGHQIFSHYDPAEVFEEQLVKCGVSYFDFYLLHNIYEHSFSTYVDKRWGILDYFLEQKRLGRIRHLGFSTHAEVDFLKEILDRIGEHMEFCQIQLNYLDWTLQKGAEKVALLEERGIPVWVMEPVRGGKLASLSAEDSLKLHELRPDESDVAWAFRFLQDIPNVKVILSGMSSMDQMVQNVRTFEEEKPLDQDELRTLLDVAEGMKDSVPCTGCRYCCEGCPQKLDIPMLISTYNEIRVSPNMNAGMRIEGMPEEKKPSACIGCRKCTKVCPQNIDIPHIMEDLTEKLKEIPSWKELSRQREEIARLNREKAAGREG